MTFRLFAGVACLLLSACVPSMPLDQAVVAYDRTTADSVSKQLLLNVARAHRNEPIHFTQVSSIAATYRVSASAGLGPAMTGNRGLLLVPLFGAAAEADPTISIAPMQGDEFTQRLLTPFREPQLTLLLRQGYDVDALLRLLGAEIRLDSGPSYVNRPTDKEGYAGFRRAVAHLSSIQDRHALYAEPLHFNHEWTVPEAAVTPETFAATYKDYTIEHDAGEHVYRVTKRINDRVMITNYDPDVLPNEERLRLHALADEAPPNEVLIDIRQGFTGGELPIHGRLRLRSFHEVLTFVGRGMGDEPESDVAPDPRTPPIAENPRTTLEISESRQPPGDGSIFVQLDGFYYAVQPQSGYQWNRKTFSLLYELFQMSVSSVTPAGPTIAISK